MKDGRWNWLNEIECVTQCEEVKASDPLCRRPPLRFLSTGVTCMKLTYSSLQGKGPTPNPLCVSDKGLVENECEGA